MTTQVRRLVVCVVAIVIAAVGLAAPAQAADAGFTFVGRGWGHGRGMGQYGALGYAVDHGWSTQQILNHYYSPATLATNAGNPEMSVELLAHTGKTVVLTAPSIWVDGKGTGNVAVKLVRNGDTIDWYAGGSCTGPWSSTPSGTIAAGKTAKVTVPASTTAVDRMLKVCGSSTSTTYRGRIDVTVVDGTQYTVNVLPTQDYLRSVVPSEMPASWANLGSGKGMQALQAQAVAARSYALAGGPRKGSGAKTCDTTACQVYSGTAAENTLSDTAITSTNGWVMRLDGAIARTEFSSSTGGYTAGGTFTAVADAGDAVSLNPNRVWTATKSASDVAKKLGVGTITSMEVTARNALGSDGGRVKMVTVKSGSSATTFTGDQVRTKLGLKSDWFSIVGPAPSTGAMPPTVVAQGHASNIGWLPWAGQGATIGTTGQSRALEAITAIYSGVSGGVLECRANVSGLGWLGWVSGADACGTTGQGRQLEAVQLRLTGADASTMTVWYRAHVQGIGWQDWTSNGSTAGTTGQGRRVEAVQILVQPSSSPAPGTVAQPRPVEYRAHAASLGWMGWVRDGALAGTTGQSRRIEAIQVRFPDGQPWSGTIQCSAHSANIGWGSWVGASSTCGTTGRSLQLEAIKLRLTGEAANQMDVWYRVHSRQVGWSGWATNGAAAGTQGRSLRAESVEIRLLPKGSAAPGPTANALRS